MGLFGKKCVSQEQLNTLKEENKTLNNKVADLESQIVTLREEQDEECKLDFSALQSKNLRENIMDIQGNLSESITSSKENLGSTEELLNSLNNISKKTGDISSVLNNLNELSDTSYIKTRLPQRKPR